jgi:hypothetical protein
MKFLLLYIFVVASAIAGTQGVRKEGSTTYTPVLNAQPAVNKFFKTPTKKCKFQGATLEESLKACIKIEGRWLHI